MTAQYLMLASAVIVGMLGSAHLLFTFVGPKLLPRDRQLRARMEEISPVITSQTTMWRAWIGFNASHSMGAMLFALVYGYLALAHNSLLFGSIYLQLVGLAMLGGLLLLAIRYWFSKPLIGISIALLCYLTSLGMAWQG